MREIRPVIDLYLLGAGVAFPEHLTVQTLEILSSCQRICTNLPESWLGGVPNDLREKFISFWELYQDGRLRHENYRDVTEAVISEVEKSRPVAWLTPGHPMVFDSVSKALLTAADSRNWNVSVVPAISCIDTLLAEVSYDPANGLAIFDATGVVRRNVPIINTAAMILLQLSVFMSERAHLTLEGDAPNLGALRDYLLNHFPSVHRCAVVRSATGAGQAPQITWVPLNDLASVPAELVAGASLFVPPLRGPMA